MRVLVKVQNFDIVKLDVEVLIHRLQDTADADVILEFNSDGLVRKGLEEAGVDVWLARLRLIMLRRRRVVEGYLKKSMMAVMGARLRCKAIAG